LSVSALIESDHSFFQDVEYFDATENKAPKGSRWWQSGAGRRGLLGLVTTAVGVALIAAFMPSSSALTAPSANDWYRLRMCESSNNYAINTGNGYYGAYQFNLATWRSVGGTGYPNQASPAVQDALALKLYDERGWEPWTCAKILGLGTSTGAPAAIAPAWPGSKDYSIGDNNTTIARWQAQMHKRGVTNLIGTGQFGANTLAVVKRIQSLNGLGVTGLLGPNTWKLAWTGRY
jgi:hypothetical protein